MSQKEQKDGSTRSHTWIFTNAAPNEQGILAKCLLKKACQIWKGLTNFSYATLHFLWKLKTEILQNMCLATTHCHMNIPKSGLCHKKWFENINRCKICCPCEGASIFQQFGMRRNLTARKDIRIQQEKTKAFSVFWLASHFHNTEKL